MYAGDWSDPRHTNSWTCNVSTYRLHARRLSGPLSCPVRDETRTAQDDDRTALTCSARDLCAEGFSVWIYDHGHETPLVGASDLRTIARYTPAGAARRPAGPCVPAALSSAGTVAGPGA